MSGTPIDLSPDLKRLRDEGYDVSLSASRNHLVIADVPYVNASREVKRGALIFVLAMDGDRAAKPPDHTAYFAGDVPFWADGSPLAGLINSSGDHHLDEGLDAQHYLSAKPPEPDPDYYHKVSRYVAAISGPARRFDPRATAQTYPVLPETDQTSPLKFIDTSSSRCGISALNAYLAGLKIAIVGLGGTGSYVLDFLVKTHVGEIHVFDGDVFSQHNAFRTPGALVSGLEARPDKVTYISRPYSAMHGGIVPHAYDIQAETLHELLPMDAVFICVDKGSAKELIIPALSAAAVPFIDTGMSIQLMDGSLTGLIRTTAGVPGNYDHVHGRVSTSDFDVDDYSHNIQVAELNALNAALAVIKWKKSLGYYADSERELDSTYVLNCNLLSNEDHQ